MQQKFFFAVTFLGWGCSFLVGFLNLLFVIPRIRLLYGNIGEQLPFLTRKTLQLSEYTQHSPLWVLGIFSLCTVGFLVVVQQVKKRGTKLSLIGCCLVTCFLGAIFNLGLFFSVYIPVFSQ